jgi:predicted MFS family arabinose efflux permease
MAIIAAGHVGKLPPALPSIRADLRLDLISAGWLASTFSTVGMFCALVFGALASRFNPWRIAVAGLALLTVSGGFGSLSLTSDQLLLSRFVEGLGFLAVVVSAPALIVSATNERDRRLALGFFSAYMPVGVSLMIFAAPAGLQVNGWRSLWIAVALSAAVGALITMVVYITSQRLNVSRRQVAWRSIVDAVAQLGPWLVAACFALYGSQLYAVITWMPTFAMEERGAASATASSATAIIVIINGSCSFAGGWLLHRGVAASKIIFIAGVIMAASGWAAFQPGLSDLARYSCVVILCGAGGFVAAASFVSAPMFAKTPSQTGILNSLIIQASNVAQFVGPAAIAVAISYAGTWDSAAWVFLGANVVMIALAVALKLKAPSH